MLRNIKVPEDFAIAATDRPIGHVKVIAMHRSCEASPHWSTSSFGSPADTSAMELAALGEHLNRCTGQRDALFSLRCAGDTMNDFAATRLITTLALFALLGVIVSLLT